MSKYSDVLSKTELFKGIEDAAQAAQNIGARRCVYEAGEVVIAQGDAAGRVGIVISGNVHIITDDFFGNRNIIASFGSGEMFGEAFACADTECMPVSAETSERTEILLLDGRALLAPDTDGDGCRARLAYNMIRILAGKNIILSGKLAIMSKRTIRAKLTEYLSREAQKAGSSEFEIPFTRSEMADFLSADRSAVSAELCRMRDEGLISFRKNKFKIYSK